MGRYEGVISLFTDDLVTEYAYYKGSSTYLMLFDLVLRMENFQIFLACDIYLRNKDAGMWIK